MTDFDRAEEIAAWLGNLHNHPGSDEPCAIRDRILSAMHESNREKARLLDSVTRERDHYKTGLENARQNYVEKQAEVERLKADVTDRDAVYQKVYKALSDANLQVESLTKLLRRAEDALGPDRTPTDRRETLMVLGKHFVENRDDASRGFPFGPKCGKHWGNSDGEAGICDKDAGHDGVCWDPPRASEKRKED